MPVVAKPDYLPAPLTAAAKYLSSVGVAATTPPEIKYFSLSVKDTEKQSV